MLERARPVADPCAIDLQDSDRARLAAAGQHHILQGEAQSPGHDPPLKAVGEPPLMLCISTFLAIRDAIAACAPDARERPDLQRAGDARSRACGDRSARLPPAAGAGTAEEPP